VEQVSSWKKKNLISENEESEEHEDWYDAKGRPDPNGAYDAGGHFYADRAADRILKVSDVDEAKYHGKTVPLNKKLPGDVKKSKVYVKKPNGKVVKVNFGDPNMRIKKSNPKRRKSFRARHRCENPGPKWKARYWSCKSW